MTQSVLIPFPVTRTGTASDCELSTELPEWRAQLRERVRAIRARKGLETTTQAAEKLVAPLPEPAAEANKGQNPIVEAALSRTRRSSDEARDKLAPSDSRPTATPRQEGSPARVAAERPKVETPPVYGDKHRAASLPVKQISQSAGPERPLEIETQEALLAGPTTDSDWEITGLDEVQSHADHDDFDSPSGPAETDVTLPAVRDIAEPIEYAGFFRRLRAAVIDIGVIAFACIPFAACVELANGDFFNRQVQIVLAAMAALLGFFYVTLMLTIAGRTLGMMSAELLALDADTMDLPSFKRAVLRVFGLVISVLPLGLGFFWSLFDSERRTFSDLISNTVVRRVSESVYDSQEIRAPWLYRSSH